MRAGRGLRTGGRSTVARPWLRGKISTVTYHADPVAHVTSHLARFSVSFRELDSRHIISTLERLHGRIEERFPGSGLGRVAREFVAVATECAEEAQALAEPNWPVRVGVGALVGVMLALVTWALWQVVHSGNIAGETRGLAELVQAAEAVVNELIFLGAAIFFLSTVETRLKRRRALRWLHQLRSIAHIVDMHQLTKDPDRLATSASDTPSSPSRALTRGELGRYLDYCSEMLSLCGKVAALFVQRFNDTLVMQSVNEIEDLTSGLSRKVWQKITLLDRP